MATMICSNSACFSDVFLQQDHALPADRVQFGWLTQKDRLTLRLLCHAERIEVQIPYKQHLPDFEIIQAIVLTLCADDHYLSTRQEFSSGGQADEGYTYLRFQVVT